MNTDFDGATVKVIFVLSLLRLKGTSTSFTVTRVTGDNPWSQETSIVADMSDDPG